VLKTKSSTNQIFDEKFIRFRYYMHQICDHIKSKCGATEIKSTYLYAIVDIHWFLPQEKFQFESMEKYKLFDLQQFLQWKEGLDVEKMH